MRKKETEDRTEHWKSIIKACEARPTDVPIYKWLKEQGISSKMYYRWRNRILGDNGNLQPCNTPSDLTFAEISVAALEDKSTEPVIESSFRPDIVIRTDKTVIELSNTASDELLSKVLGRIKHV